MAKIQNIELKVVGVTFANPDGRSRQDVIKQLMTQPNVAIGLIREPNNQYDRNAVAVWTPFGQIGYIGREYAAIIADMMDNSATKFTAVCNKIGVMEQDKKRGRDSDTLYVSITVSEV